VLWSFPLKYVLFTGVSRCSCLQWHLILGNNTNNKSNNYNINKFYGGDNEGIRQTRERCSCSHFVLEMFHWVGLMPRQPSSRIQMGYRLSFWLIPPSPFYFAIHILAHLLSLFEQVWNLVQHFLSVSQFISSRYTGRFLMFSVTTYVYNKKTKGPTLMEWFTTTGKLTKFSFDN